MAQLLGIRDQAELGVTGMSDASHQEGGPYLMCHVLADPKRQTPHEAAVNLVHTQVS